MREVQEGVSAEQGGKQRMTDNMDSREFEIKTLKNQVAEKDREIARLNQIILNATHFTLVMCDQGKKVILGALSGDIKHPITLELEAK